MAMTQDPNDVEIRNYTFKLRFPTARQWECSTCGRISVADTVEHAMWHRKLEDRLFTIEECPDRLYDANGWD